MLKFIHAADFHLDSAFGALSAKQAASRRRESRESVLRLADYVNQNGVQLVLLLGDLFDSASAFRETGEQLAQALGRMEARVFIAPGNHDWYGPGSPWLRENWPGNVHIFSENAMTAVEVPEWNLVVHGAAFTAPEQTAGLLAGFTAPADGKVHLGLLHGEVDMAESRYNPIRRQEIAQSSLAYLALGHIHKRTEPLRLGDTLCAWPGCMEGRGFDELGEKGFYEGSIGQDGAISLTFVPFASRQYACLTVDVTGKDPLAAVASALPDDTERHLYRLCLTGETGEGGVDAAALQAALSPRFYALEVRDGTRMAEDIWLRAEEDSLRGLFLRELQSLWRRAKTEEERERVTRAVRFGLAALDHRDLG
ncbi:DNA repair exonuclease [Oscillibacter sp.]|uniref:metallophosphoesterase family protein n=1 Tax=Oscillibacter sp. TaxID=1945593 RepID=UPI002603929C|nr:DNA repair exonuclease [Oscillibacter sp.]MDD3346691.1 DNA repair exonuclease [Oscillibacter sp.]